MSKGAHEYFLRELAKQKAARKVDILKITPVPKRILRSGGKKIRGAGSTYYVYGF